MGKTSQLKYLEGGRTSPCVEFHERLHIVLVMTMVMMMMMMVMVSRRPVLGKHPYCARIRAVCRSARARRVAKNLAGGLKKACKEVLDKNGAATRG